MAMIKDMYLMYKEIATEKGLGFAQAEVFAEFMLKRFPNETDGSYIRVWATRFKNVPEIYMDSESKKIFREIIDR